MLTLLYLYNHVNRREPFVVPLPIDGELVLEMNKLAALVAKPISTILKVFKRPLRGQ